MTSTATNVCNTIAAALPGSSKQPKSPKSPKVAKGKKDTNTAPDLTPLSEALAEDLDDDDAECEEKSEDESDAGSLVDFIVEDEGEGEEGAVVDDDDDAASVESEPPASKEEAIARDLDGIDQTNIVTGKRTRKQTTFYERQVFETEEYRRMVLCDVPKEDLDALEDSDDEEDDDDDEEDGSFEGDEEDEDEEGEEEDDGDEEFVPPTASAKSPSSLASKKRKN